MRHPAALLATTLLTAIPVAAQDVSQELPKGMEVVGMVFDLTCAAPKVMIKYMESEGLKLIK